MRIVDAQCHVSTVWYEPVETLLAQMDRNGVAQAVLIQRLGELDNRYQQSCRARYPERFASVVAVDPAARDACDALAALVEQGAAGVRLRPVARSPGSDPLALWRCAAALGLPVSCVGSAAQFAAADFFELVGALPDLTIVLEHLGATSQAGTTDLPVRRRVFEIAQFPNVFLKVPGLGEVVPRPTLLSSLKPVPPPESSAAAGAESGAAPTPLPAPVSPQQAAPTPPHEPAPTHEPEFLSPLAELALALESYGPERLMWGSDFPVVGSREGYANALEWSRRAVAAIMPGAVADVFGGTARRVFELN